MGFSVVSLSLGNPRFPFGNGLSADPQGFRYFLLRKTLFLAKLLNALTQIHKYHLAVILAENPGEIHQPKPQLLVASQKTANFQEKSRDWEAAIPAAYAVAQAICRLNPPV